MQNVNDYIDSSKEDSNNKNESDNNNSNTYPY